MLCQQELWAYKHLCKFRDDMHCLFSSLKQYTHSLCGLQNDFSLSGIQSMGNTKRGIMKRSLGDTTAIKNTKKSLHWGNVYVLDFCNNDNLPIALTHRQEPEQQVEAIDAAHPSTCVCVPEGAMDAEWDSDPLEAVWECNEWDTSEIAAVFEENQKQSMEEQFESPPKRKKMCLWQ